MTVATAPPHSLDLDLVELLIADPDAERGELIERLRATDPLVAVAEVTATVDRAIGRSRGLGRIEALLTDPSLTEVMINGPGPVWIDRGPGVEPTDLLLDEREIFLLVERVLDPLGLRVDRSSPIVDARLPDGSRVNVVVPPLALDGPVVTIRRFPHRPIPLDRFGDDGLIDLLAELVSARSTMLVVGSTAAGKTTLLNAIGGLFSPEERVVTIEDTAELRLPGRHVVRLEARPPNSEGVGAVTLRQLVRTALRMRPDRLVIGEVRGSEALDLVLALNTGHRGSLATCHASDPEGALRRIETLALMAEAALPADAIREQLRGAIDVILRVARVGPDRLVTDVVAVTPDGHRPETLWALTPRAAPLRSVDRVTARTSGRSA